MHGQRTGDRPIGHWLKRADRAIEESFDALLGGEGLGRRHWQVLNVLHADPAGTSDVEAALAPFLTPGDGTADAVLADLVERSWVGPSDAAGTGGFRLTDEGIREFARLRERVRTHRAGLLRGVSPDEYRTTLHVLARICANAAG
jgi:DNA-binding MarR family transcriptional regulator